MTALAEPVVVLPRAAYARGAVLAGRMPEVPR